MQLRNSRSLQESAALQRIAAQLAARMAPGEAVVSERVLSSKQVQALLTRSGWIAARSAPAWGVAALCQGPWSPGTALAGSRAALQLAGAVRSELGLGPYGDDALVVTPSGPPLEWACVEVTTTSGSVVCAGAFPSVASLPKVEASLRPVSTRILLQTESSKVSPGAVVQIGSTLVAELPELGIKGVVECTGCEEGNERGQGEKGGVVMKVVSESQEMGHESALESGKESGSVPVRIDLGSLELTVADVAALRPGAQLEIDGRFPAECFLRIGATALARGVLAVGDGGFTLCVDEVF